MNASQPYARERLESFPSAATPLTERLSRITYAAVLLLAALTATGHAQGRTDPSPWLQEAEDAYGRFTNYTAVLHKQQRVEGKLLPEETRPLTDTGISYAGMASGATLAQDPGKTQAPSSSNSVPVLREVLIRQWHRARGREGAARL